MGAGPKGLAGVDHEVERAVAQRRPGRPNPDGGRAPHEHRLVELLPALGPVLGDVLSAHAHDHARHLRLPSGERRQLARRAVERVFDEAVAVHLLHARRRQLQQRREHLLGGRGRSAEREPDQRNARRSLPTIESSAGSRRLSSVSDSRSSSSSSRWRVVSLRGITTLSTTCWSPRPRRPIDGIPFPRSVTTVPGWVPAGTSIRSSPSSVGTLTVVPSAAAGAGTSTTLTRSAPSRTKRSSSATRTST